MKNKAGCHGHSLRMSRSIRPATSFGMGVGECMRLRHGRPIQDDEIETFSAASEVSGLSLSAWIRERLRKISRQELEEAGEEVPLKKKPKKE